MAAVDPALYAFLTASLLHVRSSFRGFAALMQDFHHFPHVEHLHDKLLYAWLVYQAVTQLQDNYWEALQSVSFCFQRHNADLRTDTLGALYLPLQSAFLKDFAQSHQCVTCIRHPVVAFDGKVNRAVPVCCCKTGRTMHLLRGDVVLDYGCLAPRLHGSYACALHHTDAAVAKSQLQCFRGHKLRRKKHKLAIECNQCNAVISAAAPCGLATWAAFGNFSIHVPLLPCHLLSSQKQNQWCSQISAAPTCSNLVALALVPRMLLRIFLRQP
jgi:hypothetical protein